MSVTNPLRIATLMGVLFLGVGARDAQGIVVSASDANTSYVGFGNYANDYSSGTRQGRGSPLPEPA